MTDYDRLVEDFALEHRAQRAYWTLPELIAPLSNVGAGRFATCAEKRG